MRSNLAFVAADDDWAVDLPALRMLRDCGVVRASVGHVGLRMLWDNEIASATPTADGRLDYRLTANGHVTARNLLNERTEQ